MVISRANSGTHAGSWAQAKRLAREQGYGTKITVPKAKEPTLPLEFEQSLLSIPGGANAVYRDQRKTDSFQIREYNDHWTIELDKHNPEEGNPLAHAVQDAPKYTLAAVAIVGAAMGGFNS